MKIQAQFKKTHLAYAYVVMFGLFVLGVLFVFFLLPNLPDMMETSLEAAVPEATVTSVASFM